MRTVSISPALPPLSVIALGTATFGSAIPTETSEALLDAYIAGGGNVLDTAHCYAAWLPDGEGASERCIGDWLMAREIRDQVVISTKGGHPPMDALERPRLRPGQLTADLDDSLERLGVEHIDLYWLHRDDPAIPVGEILDTLEGHRKAGRIRAYGASNWSITRLDDAAVWAKKRGHAGFCADQPGWSLAEHRTDVPSIPGCLNGDEVLRMWHHRMKFPTMAYTSQANGFFSKQPEQVPAFDTPTNRERAMRARDLAKELDTTANRIALAWLTSQTFPGIAIVGPKRVEQLADSLLAGDLQLTAEQVEWLAHG